jgi:hypothetical protein
MNEFNPDLQAALTEVFKPLVNYQAEAEKAFDRRMKNGLTAEIEAELSFGGHNYPVTLYVYGKHHAYHPGQSGGRGEQRLSPEEPAHWEIDEVRLCNGHYFESIDSALSESIMDGIAEYIAEEA